MWKSFKGFLQTKREGISCFYYVYGLITVCYRKINFYEAIISILMIKSKENFTTVSTHVISEHYIMQRTTSLSTR